MIVLDASAAVDLLLNTPGRGPWVARRLRDDPGPISAPHLLDAEIGQVIRRALLRGSISPRRAGRALDRVVAMPILRWGHRSLLERAFELRENLTFYDGLYVALAERLDATLLTGDRRLAAAPGLRAPVAVVPG